MQYIELLDETKSGTIIFVEHITHIVPKDEKRCELYLVKEILELIKKRQLL